MADASKKKSKKKADASPLIKIGTGLLIGLICAVFAYLSSYLPFVQRAEFMSLDLRYQTREPIEIYPHLGYVNLDNESCELAGPWPWARSYHVALVQSLAFYGARSAGYDVFFAEPSSIEQRPAPNLAGLDEDQKAMALSGMFRNHDEVFEEALKESGIIYLGKFLASPEQFGLPKDASPAVIRAELERRQASINVAKKEAIEVAKEDGWPSTPQWDASVDRTIEITPPLTSLALASEGVGFEQIIPDNITGTVYEYPMFLEYDGVIYPALGMLMAADILGIDLSNLEFTANEEVIFTVTKPEGNVKAGPMRVPVNAKVRSLMNWSAPYFDSFFHINFRKLSKYHGLTQIKMGLLERLPNLGSQPQQLLESVYSWADGERWMESQEALLATQRCLAGLMVMQEAELGREGLIQKLKAQPELYGEGIETTIDAVLFAMQVLERAQPEDLTKVAEEVHLHRYLEFAPHIIDTTAFPALDLNHAKEIARNVLWFQHQDRLEEVMPLYFPPCLQSHADGKIVDISPTMLHKKVLMIGLEGEGTIDLNPQPYQESCAMVALHANAINSFMTDQFLGFAKKSDTMFFLLLLSLLIATISQFLSTRWSFSVYMLAMIAYSAYAYFQFSEHGQHVEWIVPVLGLSFSYMLSVGLQLYFAYREKAKMKGMFGKMVSPDVLKEMTDNPELFSLTGQRKACTSTFSSMENYAAIVKGVTPQEMTGLLGSYLTPASQIITSYKGYIDKYEGHIIMSEFGVPIPKGDHRQQCLYSSIEQQLDVTAFKHHIHMRTGKNINVSIGVNTGFVSAGNMGSDKKMQYTIMGDTVNTAARFRPANWIYDYLGSTIIGEGTFVQVADMIHSRPLDRLLLKGKLKPVNIYEVRGWDPEAYLESRGKDDVTETLQVCWADHCPSGKIVGYQLHFEEQFRRTQHPLAQELAEFFQSQQGIAGERNTAVMVKEICDNGTYYLSLNERFEAITNKTLSEIPKGAWKEKMTTWAKGLKQHLDLLEQEYRGNPEADKLHRDLLDVYEKIEAQEERLELEMELPGPLSKSWDDIRAYASTAFETDDTDHQERIDELNNIYKETASGLVASVSKRMDEYHAMMALAGSMTEKEKRGCETYAKALSLHWERKWDESLEAFEACLVDLPGDKAAMEFIGRVKRYKDDPPPESWQGEFKQTKK